MVFIVSDPSTPEGIVRTFGAESHALGSSRNHRERLLVREQPAATSRTASATAFTSWAIENEFAGFSGNEPPALDLTFPHLRKSSGCGAGVGGTVCDAPSVLCVLMVEGNPRLRERITALFEGSSDVEHVSTDDVAILRLEQATCDVVIVRLCVPGARRRGEMRRPRPGKKYPRSIGSRCYDPVRGLAGCDGRMGC